MRTTKRILVAAVVAAAVLAATMAPVYAAPEGRSQNQEPLFDRAQRLEQLREALRSRLQLKQSNGETWTQEPINVDDLDEGDAEDLIEDIEGAELVDETPGPIWMVHIRGRAWAAADTVESAQADPMAMNLALSKVKATEAGTVYEVLRGFVVHNGTRMTVEGKAVLRGDGVFALRLTGEDLELKAVGRVARARVGVRVAMRGRMVDQGEEYGFRLAGRAVPIRAMWAWRRAAPSSEDAKPTPSAYGARARGSATL
jgi:hypothetical protein